MKRPLIYVGIWAYTALNLHDGLCYIKTGFNCTQVVKPVSWCHGMGLSVGIADSAQVVDVARQQ